MRRAALLSLPVLLLAGCGGGESEAAPATPAANSTAATTATAVTTPAATTTPEDTAGRANCLSADLTYLPLRSALTTGSGVQDVIGFLTPVEPQAATSQAGKDAAVALAELNVQLAMEGANALTGQAPDTVKLSSLLDALDAACVPLR